MFTRIIIVLKQLYCYSRIIKAVSDFAENLRNAMFNKRCKGVDVARATKITPSTISRYLSGTHQPTTENLIAISKYLGVSPETLLSSSEAPGSFESSKYISSDKDKVIAVQEELIKNLQKQVGGLEKQVKEWEKWKASIREKTKNPTKPNKQKVGFLKKHKKTKS